MAVCVRVWVCVCVCACVLQLIIVCSAPRGAPLGLCAYQLRVYATALAVRGERALVAVAAPPTTPARRVCACRWWRSLVAVRALRPAPLPRAPSTHEAVGASLP